MQLNLAYFAHQQSGAEAISSQNRIADPYGGTWKILRSSELEIGTMSVLESEIAWGDSRILVWKWFLVGNTPTSSLYVAKLYEAYNRLVKRRRDVTIVTLATPLLDSTDSRDRLQVFYQLSIIALSHAGSLVGSITTTELVSEWPWYQLSSVRTI